MKQARVVDYAKIGYSVVEIPICHLNRKFLGLKKMSQVKKMPTFDAFLLSFPNGDSYIKGALHL